MSYIINKYGEQNINLSKNETILVIGPGASTKKNSKLYSNLSKEVHIIEIHPNNQKDGYAWEYPINWQSDELDLNTNNKKNLATFANMVFDAILNLWNDNKEIKCILCGSRGGQVILPQLFRIFLDLNINYKQFPPCIIMNSGLLHAKVKWPKNIPIIFISFKNDYFDTKNLNLVIKKIIEKKNIDNYGYIIQTNDSHLPNKELHLIINIIIKYIPQNNQELINNLDIFYRELTNKINDVKLITY